MGGRDGPIVLPQLGVADHFQLVHHTLNEGNGRVLIFKRLHFLMVAQDDAADLPGRLAMGVDEVARGAVAVVESADVVSCLVVVLVELVILKQ